MAKTKQKIQTSWDLSLFAKNPTKKDIERELQKLERRHAAFAKKYRGRSDYLKNETKLAAALKEYEALEKSDLPIEKLFRYFWFKKELDSSDTQAQAIITLLADRLTKIGNLTIFFGLALGRIEKQYQKKFLKSQKLARYHYLLERAFLESAHQLTEPEEKILSLKHMPARGLWVEGNEKLLSTISVRFEGKDIPLSEAVGKVADLSTGKRRQLGARVMEALRAHSDFAESELNAVVIDKKIDDELRGFRKPYSATVLAYENDEESVEALVESVTKAFSMSRRFYKLKKELLGLDELTYADRAASIGKTRATFPFEKSYERIREIFYSLDSVYGRIFDDMVANGQIDVYPKTGKGGGAYCAGGAGVPTMVLLNHVDSFNSLLTLAHEMGHAIHTERSKEQPLIYQGYTTSVAETASTFFESFVFEEIFKTLSGKEQMIALHDKINDDISTVFRQIAFFNFENELHTRIRAEGFLPKEEIAKLLNAHLQRYLGPAVSLDERDGYFFVYVTHFRRPFYVYSYTYGQLISKALVARVQEDPEYIRQVDTFLTAGKARSPEQIFADIGIDTTNPEFFQEGLQRIATDIKELERLKKKYYN